MSSPFIGEIRMFAGNFAPVGWSFCNGAIIPIDQNDALFNLIGTTYGGDGVSTFALPDLQGRVPVHVGPSYTLGQSGGAETVTVTTSQIPAHGHAPAASSNAGTAQLPAGNLPATWSAPQYTDASPTGLMASGVQSSGGSQPHDNMVPFVAVNFILSLFGIFPSQT